MKGVDLMSNQISNTPISRSCLTSLHCKLKTFSDVKNKTNLLKVTNNKFLMFYVASVLPDSRLTSAQTINSKRQRDTPLSVLNDISNIRNSLANTEFGSSSGRSHNQTEHEATDEDDFDEGNWRLCSTKANFFRFN